MPHSPRVLLLAALSASALAITACSPPHQQDSTERIDTASQVAVPSSASSSSTVKTTENEASAQPITLVEGYVKAKPGEKDMTAIFGTLTNTSDEPVHITGFTTSLYAGINEIHEVVDGVMRQRENGITLAPGETHVLQPGGDHLMLMDIAKPIEAGDTVTVTLILEDGTGVRIPDVPVRTINSGEEDYGVDGALQSGADQALEKDRSRDNSTAHKH